MSSISLAIILMVACLCLTYASSLAEEVKTPDSKAAVNYRLPLKIKPVNYKISLKPYLNESHPRKFTFDGECFIEIQPAENTNEIQLHMKNLNISFAECYMKNSSEKINLNNSSYNSLTSIVVYRLDSILLANVSYILHYKYIGSMDDDMHGFYRSSYVTSKNVTKWIGSTQFQRNHARRVFPSFDEPKFKATFDLSLTRHRSLRSTGPTRITAIEKDGDYITDIYETTPKMSTYILAFIVSEFNDRSDGYFGVLARSEYYSQTEYSFDVGKDILKALDNYLGIPYYSMGNDKMHMAAIPDFSAGAMENWGLLTYRETALLYDEEHSTRSSKQYIASIVAHEQAHMWFGDLVTCEWWSVTWLNEGFASYFQYFATHMVESDFRMDQQFVVNDVQTVMYMDATNDTNPMSDENTNTEAELARMFNSISYNKGGTVIRMTKHVLGENNFKISLNEYLNKHKYTNTIPSDLFSVWKKYWPKESIQYADSFFESFTTQVGYPVITFNRTSKTKVQVSQKRFLLKDFDKADPNLLYTVPITYTTSDEKNFQNTTPKFFLEKNPIQIPINNNTKWIVGNIQETGYYRVNYDTKTWHQIHHALYANNWDGIHELNRAQIVDDLLNLARAGEIDYSLALAVLEYLETETNYLPWTSAFNGFSFLATRLGTDRNDFARYICDITEKAFNNLGFEEKKDDTTFDIYTRAKILAWSCKFGNAKCVSEALLYFRKNLKLNPIPVNIRGVVYCTAMREANEQDFDKLYHKFKTETVATEKSLILGSFGCVLDEKLVSRVFHMIMSDEVRRQDKSSTMSSLYSENNENVDLVFDLVDQNIEQLSKAVGGYANVAVIVSNIAARFTTEAQLSKLKAFNEKHKDKFGGSLQGAVAIVEFNLEWSKTNLGAVRSFLTEHGRNGASVNSISTLTILIVLTAKILV